MATHCEYFFGEAKLWRKLFATDTAPHRDDVEAAAISLCYNRDLQVYCENVEGTDFTLVTHIVNPSSNCIAPPICLMRHAPQCHYDALVISGPLRTGEAGCAINTEARACTPPQKLRRLQNDASPLPPQMDDESLISVVLAQFVDCR